MEFASKSLYTLLLRMFNFLWTIRIALFAADLLFCLNQCKSFSWFLCEFSCPSSGVPIAQHREAAQNIFMDKIMGFADVSLLEPTEYSFMRNAVSTRNLDLSSRNTVVSYSIVNSNIFVLNKFIFPLIVSFLSNMHCHCHLYACKIMTSYVISDIGCCLAHDATLVPLPYFVTVLLLVSLLLN